MFATKTGRWAEPNKVQEYLRVACIPSRLMQLAQNDPVPMQALRRLDHPRPQRINYSGSHGRAARVTVTMRIYALIQQRSKQLVSGHRTYRKTL
jgi:hypothetical protein